MNFVLFMVVLYSTTHYSYTNYPELFGVKNVLMPYEAAVFLSLMLALILAGINEITTVIVIKLTKRK